MFGRLILASAALLTLYLATKKGATTSEPQLPDYRGRTDLAPCMQKNNPGCMRRTATQWRGEVASSRAFAVFENIGYGLRATYKNIINKPASINTISALITLLSPPSENNTAQYISFVASQTGIGANQIFNRDKPTLKKLVRAICKMENSGFNLSDEELEAGFILLQKYPN